MKVPDYATNFRRIRENEGYTQEDLAERMGLCVSIVNRIENNKRKFTLDLVPKLALTTNKSAEDIFVKLNGTNVTNIASNNQQQIQITRQLLTAHEQLIAEKDKRLAEKERYIVLLEQRLNH